MMIKLKITIGLILFGLQAVSQIDTTFNLWMWTTGEHYFWDGSKVESYGFTIGIGRPRIPGPVLRVTEGDSVVLHVRNQSQGAPHSVHLHGLDVDQANDGVPATSWDIKHKEIKDYKFKATHPGTYLYHCHVATVLHVQYGMYGVLIVEPKTKGKLTDKLHYGRDFSLLFSEADKSWFDNKPRHAKGDSVYAEIKIPKYEPDYFMVNGNGKQLIDTMLMRPDENVLIRLSNIGYFQNLVKFPSSVTATLVTSDGRTLPQSTSIDSLYITPGERYGVLLSPIGKNSGQIIVKFQDLNTGITKAMDYIPYTYDETLGIGLVSKQTGVNLFPNPARGDLNILFEKQLRITSYKIINAEGMEVLDMPYLEFEGNELSIDISTLSTGLYFLRLNTEGEAVYSFKFLVN